MEVSNSVSGRPAWYDRSPATKTKNYDATLAPAGTTNRWSYTVPSNKKALLDVFQARVIRVTAAGVVGLAFAFVRIVSSDTLNADFSAALRTNGVGDKDSVVVGSGIPLVAGDQCLGDTYDDSTTGTVEHQLQMHLTEFDA